MPLAAGHSEYRLSRPLTKLRRRIRQLTWCHGLGQVVTISLGLLLLTVACDWLVHINDRGTRGLFALLAGSCVAVVFWKRLMRPLSHPLTAEFLARQLERQHPQLGQTLTSSLEFLHGQRPGDVSSRELQHSAVEEALSRLPVIDVDAVLEPQPAYRWLTAGLATAAMTGLFIVAVPQLAWIGAQRWLTPWQDIHWPRQVQLVLFDQEHRPLPLHEQQPHLIAQGQPWELHAWNTIGRLPTVTLEFARADGTTLGETMRRVTQTDEAGRTQEFAVSRLVGLTGELRIRVRGGDHQDMPWYPIRVVAPPYAESLQLTVSAPSYTAMPSRQLPPGLGHVQAWVGSTVDVVGRSSKPLQAVSWVGRNDARAEWSIDKDRQTFRGRFTVNEPGSSSYRIELVDDEGFRDPLPPVYEVTGQQDQVPGVTITAPETDLRVTRTAVVPFQIDCRDDLALSQLQLRYEVGDGRPAVVIPLARYRLPASGSNAASISAPSTSPDTTSPDSINSASAGPVSVLRPFEIAPEAAAAGLAISQLEVRDSAGQPVSEHSSDRAGAIAGVATDPDQSTGHLSDGERSAGGLLTGTGFAPGGTTISSVTLTWDLSRLELPEAKTADPRGVTLMVVAEATDGFDLGPAHLGRSLPRTLTIVEPELKRRELSDRTGQLLDELRQAARRQTAAREQIEQLQLQADRAGELRPQDRDALSRAELDQRALSDQLADVPGGMAATSQALLDELTQNQLHDPELARQLARVRETLRALQQAELPEIDRRLATARKLVQSGSDRPSATREPPTSPPAAPTPDSVSPPAADVPGSRPAAEQSAAEPASPAGGAAESGADTSPESSSAAQRAEVSSTPQNELALTLSEAAVDQTQVQSQLDGLVRELSQWRNERTVKRELDSVLESQAQLEQELAQLAPQTLSRNLSELSPQLRADLAKLGNRQRQIGERVGQLEQQLGELAQRLADSDLGATTALEQAREQLQQAGADSLLKSAAQEIERNRLGQAGAQQQQADRSLEAARDQLKSNRPQPEQSEDLLEKVAAAGDNVEELMKRVDELTARIDELAARQAAESSAAESPAPGSAQPGAADQPNEPSPAGNVAEPPTGDELQAGAERGAPQSPDASRPENPADPNEPEELQQRSQLRELQAEQQAAREELAALERQLERLQQKQAAAAVRRARRHLDRAAAKLQQESPDLGTAGDEQAAAADDLEEAQDKLDAVAEELRDQLATEAMLKIVDRLSGLTERQQSLNAETLRLDSLRQPSGQWSRGQLRSLRELSENQHTLAGELASLANEIQVAEIVAFGLSSLSKWLTRLGGRLAERDAGADLQAQQAAALSQLRELQEILKSTANDRANGQTQQPDPAPSDGKQPPATAGPEGESISYVTQLKLARLLQQSYLDRTRALDEAVQLAGDDKPAATESNPAAAPDAKAPAEPGSTPTPTTTTEKPAAVVNEPLSQSPPAVQAELARLSAEQLELAGLIRNLLMKFQPQQSADKAAGERDAAADGEPEKPAAQ